MCPRSIANGKYEEYNTYKNIKLLHVDPSFQFPSPSLKLPNNLLKLISTILPKRIIYSPFYSLPGFMLKIILSNKRDDSIFINV
jgi:hypothetical protein